MNEDRDFSPPVVIGGLEKLDGIPEELKHDLTDVLVGLGSLFANSLETGIETVLTSRWMARLCDRNSVYPWWIPYGPAVRFNAESAAAGEASGLHNMGVFHRYGLGMKRHDETALAFFIEACQQNHPLALLECGLMLERGLGAERDTQFAITLFERASEHGLAEARYRLGALLRRGLGGPGRIPEAREWLERAARQDSHLAMFEFALMLAQGEGGPVDLPGALRWLEHAALHVEAASVCLAFYRDAPQHFSQARPPSRVRGEAQYRRGLGALWGIGRSVDEGEAGEALEKAARTGHLAAQYHLGWMHANVVGSANSLRLARHWLGRASRRGYPAAGYDYATLPNQRPRWAAGALKRSVAGGHTGSKFLLGRAYVGYGGAEDENGEWRLETGQRLIDEAAAAGDHRALLESDAAQQAGMQRLEAAGHLGCVHAQVRMAFLASIDDRPDEAFGWWLLAAEQGHAQAMITVLKELVRQKGRRDNSAIGRWLVRLMPLHPEMVMHFVDGLMYGQTPQPDWGWEPLISHYQHMVERDKLRAVCQLAWFYEHGLGIGHNPVAAHELYRRVINEIDATYRDEMLILRSAKRGVIRLLDGADASPGDRSKAFDLRKALVAESLEDPRDAYNLALMYLYGRGTSPSIPKAIQWLEAVSGFPPAELKLGEMYQSGDYVQKDLDRARAHLRMAAIQLTDDRASATSAMLMLGELEAPEAPEVAYRWFRLASHLGVPEASQRIREILPRLQPIQKRRARVAAADWQRWYSR